MRTISGAAIFYNKRTVDGFKKGIKYFQQAIDRDPTYAPAYVGLANCYALLQSYDELPPKDLAPKAKEAVTKALEIDATLAEAHASLAWTRMHYDWDWAGTEREFQRAIELNPNYAEAHHWYGLYLATRQRFDKAMAELNRARELDPLSLIISTNVGWLFYFARQYDQAIEQYGKTLEMDPNFFPARIKLAYAYAQKGMYEEAISEFQKAGDNSGGSPFLADLGYAYAIAGKSAEAEKVLDELEGEAAKRYISPFDIAIFYTGLGEKDRAFGWLEKAYEDRNGTLAWLKVDPKLDSLRSDPRFTNLLLRVGLVP